VERARTRRGRSDPEGALELWRGLVDGSWTLADYFESDGRRYLVARRNEPTPLAPCTLSLRERQVLAFAARGQSNKLIAYQLGLSTSTVGVHLSRAVRKLGVGSRMEAVRAFRRMERESRNAPDA
jgi:two-component system nitrate/nitrite response regulator NarL